MIVDWLQSMAELPAPYGLLEKVVFRQGKIYPIIPKPKEFKFGKMKECFKNSADAALRGMGHYVEGFATVRGLVAVHHAWIADDEGNAIDLTWRDGQLRGAEYFGIAFEREELSSELLRRKIYGLLSGPTSLNVELIEKLDPSLMADARAAVEQRKAKRP